MLERDELVTQQNNYYLMSHFNQPNMERKNCLWTTKYESLSEMCIVQHVKMESVFTFQPVKRLVSTTVNLQRLMQRFEYSFKDQKPTILLFGGDGTHCFGKKMSRDYEKEKPSPFLKKFFRQS